MRISPLVNHPELVPTVAQWCCEEWPWYYANGDLAAACAYHQQTAQAARVPSGLVALEGSTLAGTISVIEDDMETRPELNPWLGCLVVAPEFRRQGLASRLIDEGELLAKRLAVPVLYAWTETLCRLLLSKGWAHVEDTAYRGRRVSILSKTMSP